MGELGNPPTLVSCFSSSISACLLVCVRATTMIAEVKCTVNFTWQDAVVCSKINVSVVCCEQRG